MRVEGEVHCGCGASLKLSLESVSSEVDARKFVNDQVEEFWPMHNHTPCPDVGEHDEEATPTRSE